MCACTVTPCAFATVRGCGGGGQTIGAGESEGVNGSSAPAPATKLHGAERGRGKQVSGYQLVKQTPKQRVLLYFDEILVGTLSYKK